MLGENYPDPLSSFTTIPYEIPYETKGRIIIKDVLGKIIKVIDINSEKREVNLKTDDWALGIYYYSLEINNEIIDTKKMILSR